jgi:hypothetical protein
METKPKTNADRIRNMTDEELADICDGLGCPPNPREACCNDCKRCWSNWFKSPVEDAE